MSTPALKVHLASVVSDCFGLAPGVNNPDHLNALAPDAKEIADLLLGITGETITRMSVESLGLQFNSEKMRAIMERRITEAMIRGAKVVSEKLGKTQYQIGQN